MPRSPSVIIAISTLLLIARLAPATHAAPDPKLAHDLYDRITPSLVVVQFTYESELGRRELHGMGVVVRDDGLIMCSMGLTPPQVPDEQMRSFKVILPGDDEVELDALFQGRDERTGVAFVKVTESRDWKPITFEDISVNVGEPLISIGLLPKHAGYKSYMAFPIVSANLRGPVPQVLVTPDALGNIGSPVFNLEGKAVGFVNNQQRQSALLDTDPRDPFPAITDPPRFFTPARDFLLSLEDPPLAGQPQKLPWLGVSSLSGLKKEVAEYFGLSDPAVQLGDVVPGFPAEQAGLKSGDVIVKFNGQSLERGDQPEEIPQILTRKISRMKVGQTITFTILRGGKDEPLKDITITLGERPKQANKAARFWAEDLGFSVRQVVFDDLYIRRLPPESTGVVVALVKPGSAAQAQDRLRAGDLIQQINQVPVESLEHFKEQYETFRKTHPRDAVIIELLRGVNTQVVRIEPPQ